MGLIKDIFIVLFQNWASQSTPFIDAKFGKNISVGSSDVFDSDDVPFVWPGEAGFEEQDFDDSDFFDNEIEFCSYHPDVNVDGTPMIPDSWMDVNGDPFGCPSSFCDSDDMFSDDGFDDSTGFGDDEW